MKSRSFVRSVATAAAASLVLVGMTFGQGILKNGGTFTNTGTATYKAVENYKSSSGTIVNSGTLSTTTAGGGTGVFDNTTGALNGTVLNFSGATHGTITVATTLDNANSAVIDNDNAGVGRLRVGGTFTAGGTFDTDSGAVEYFGGAGQTIVKATYGALITSGAATKTVSDTVVVRDSLRVDAGSTLALDATTDTLAILSSANTLAGSFSPALGAVNYGANANQTVFAGTYQRLWLSGSLVARTKATTGAIAFAASGLLNVGTNDTLEVSAGLDLATNTPSFTNSSVVKPLANATFHSGISDAGTFYYAGTGAQTVGSVTYTNLLLLNEGVKSFPDEDTVWVNGNYSIVPGAATGSRDYDSTSTVSTLAFTGTGGSQTISGLDGEHMNIVQFEGSSTKALNGTFVEARKLTLAAGGLVTNNATTLRLSNISGISLSLAASSSLTNSATRTITMNGDLENDGAITNAGTISVY